MGTRRATNITPQSAAWWVSQRPPSRGYPDAPPDVCILPNGHTGEEYTPGGYMEPAPCIGPSYFRSIPGSISCPNGVQIDTQMSRCHEIHGFGEILDLVQIHEIHDFGVSGVPIHTPQNHGSVVCHVCGVFHTCPHTPDGPHRGFLGHARMSTYRPLLRATHGVVTCCHMPSHGLRLHDYLYPHERPDTPWWSAYGYPSTCAFSPLWYCAYGRGHTGAYVHPLVFAQNGIFGVFAHIGFGTHIDIHVTIQNTILAW